jgi:HEAT repeat protein
LIAAIKDKDKYVRESAATSLGDLGDKRALRPLIQALRGGDESMRRTAEKALLSLGEAVIEELVGLLQDADWDVRWRAVHVLGATRNKAACDPLIARLRDENRYVREAAAIALGEIADGCAVKPLIAALQDENKYVREEAAAALAEMKDKRSLGPLIKALHDKDWGVRWGVANALGELEDPSAIDPLIEALDDEVRYVREGVASALQRIGKPAVKKLIENLQGPSPNVRRWSAWALGKIKDQRAAKGLINALQDKDAGVQFAAEVALTELEE